MLFKGECIKYNNNYRRSNGLRCVWDIHSTLCIPIVCSSIYAYDLYIFNLEENSLFDYIMIIIIFSFSVHQLFCGLIFIAHSHMHLLHHTSSMHFTNLHTNNDNISSLYFSFFLHFRSIDEIPIPCFYHLCTKILSFRATVFARLVHWSCAKL